MDMSFAYLFTIASVLSVVNGENCGYIPGPVASTKDTVVIKLDCEQSTSLSQHVPLQVCDNATHVAVQLVHCHTVPVGLFTNITDNLASVTVASEDAVQLLDGTFEGLEMVRELRLLGFTMLKNLSRSLLEPLRSIQTLILDGFGRDNIELSYLGSVIRKLSGTPIRRLVLNEIKGQSVFEQIVKVDDFSISNASVKELIITDAPLDYLGSIRRAFPDLVCFCGARIKQTDAALPAIWDLMLLSDHVEDVTFYRPKDAPSKMQSINRPAILTTPTLTSIFMTARLYPDLVRYYFDRLKETEDRAKDCELGFALKFGANLSKVAIRGLELWIKTEKPFCVQEDNNLTYLDFTGSQFPSTVPLPVVIGLKKVQYVSLENTGVRKIPTTFLRYLPSLKVLKLSKNDIGDFIENVDGDFFGSRPTLSDVHLDGCNLTNISTTIFSWSVSLQHLNMSENHLRTFDFDLQNCTRLNILNFSRNSIGSITQKRIDQLTRLASQKAGGDNLVVDLGGNRLHCLCNSTHFIEWLQRSPVDTNIKFQHFDSYTCLYPNGSIVRSSEVVVSKLEQQCRAIQTLVNDSDCPCDEEQRSRLRQVWVHLNGFVCRNHEGDAVAMMTWPLPTCFNPYTRATFIAPVVVGGILGIGVLLSIGLLIYYRNTRRVRQVRECLEMNPARFVRAALQYAMMHNHDEEHAMFRYDMIIFVQDADQSSVHSHFVEALQGRRRFITRDDFLAGAAVVEAMAESVDVCRWILPVLTAKFLSDPACVDFINRVQFDRPHALIPIVWEQSLEVTEVSVAELLRTGDPLYWPGDRADPVKKRNFWSSLLERTASL